LNSSFLVILITNKPNGQTQLKTTSLAEGKLFTTSRWIFILHGKRWNARGWI